MPHLPKPPPVPPELISGFRTYAERPPQGTVDEIRFVGTTPPAMWLFFRFECIRSTAGGHVATVYLLQARDLTKPKAHIFRPRLAEGRGSSPADAWSNLAAV